MTLRPVEPLNIPNLPKTAVKGARPILQWVKPTSLLVDETYQRDLSERSMVLIRKMLQGFAWNRMKPPIVAKVDGQLHVIDGQHTAIVAATLGLAEIPIFLVEAPSLDERARSFVGHNSDRIVVSPFNIFHALLASGDPAATDVAAVCKRAGVTIRILTGNNIAIRVGDTAAIGTVRSLVSRRGVMMARKVLEVLVRAKRAPVSAGEIVAVENLMCVEMRDVDPDDLIAVIRIDGDRGFRDAKAKAAQNRIPLWRGLIARWTPKLKRRAAA
jgi:hypothetical protein